MDTPFLPDGRRWLWSAHSLELAETCERKYYYVDKCGYTSRDENTHARFGIEVAKANELFEKLRAGGASFDDALRDVVEQALKNTWDGEPLLQYEKLALLPGSAKLKTRENLIRTIIWYFLHYRNDPCQTAERPDGSPAVELSFTLALDDEIMLRGRMDRIVKYAGETYVQDTKTTGATLSGYYFKRYNPDIQMSLYSLAGGIIFGSPISGVMIDAMQVAVGFSRFERGFAYRTEAQLEEWLKNATYHIHNIWEAEQHGWPMRESSCQKYGGCPFIDVCNKDPRVRDDFLKGNYVVRDRSLERI